MLLSLHNFDDHVIWCHNIGDTQPRKPCHFLNELNAHRLKIATVWAMWKKGEHYNPAIDRQLKTEVEV